MQNRMEIGKIVNTFGIKGELKVLTYNDYFDKNKEVYINNKKMEIEKVRFQKNIAIVKFKDLDDMTEAENLKGATIEIDETSAPKLPKDTYYIKDLIGLDVYTDDGKLLGKLDDVFNTGANDIYQIGKILLPATKEVIKKIDIDNKKITVHILEGLL